MEKERPAFAAGAEALLTKIANGEFNITSDARAEFKRAHGHHSKGVSLGRDKDGYYVYTHRARSKSYPTPAKIPHSKVTFVSSTG